MLRNLVSTSSRTLRTTTSRPFSISTIHRANDKFPDDKHTVNKAKSGDQNDIQSANAKAGLDADKKNTGGNATEQRDSAGGKEKAKKEFPEAPDVAIGMQDERGGKGA